VNLDVAAYLLRAAVVALALALARRRQQYQIVAAFLTSLAALDLLRFYVVRPLYLGQTTPYAGAARFWFHVGEVIFIGWPVGIAAVALRVFLARRPVAPLLAGAAASVALVVGYPWPFRGDGLAYFYTAAQVAAVLTGIACAAVWTKRGDHLRPEHATSTLLTLLSAALFAGPLKPVDPHPFEMWSAAQIVYSMLWTAILLVQMGAIWWKFMLPPFPRGISSRLH
jgi:hypothetical protein